MSKLLETYNKSLFANIGNKVTNIQQFKIPNADKNIQEFDTKSIEEVQKDFSRLIALPYSTLLTNQSDFGKIKVNPTISVLSLFGKLNNNISPIIVSNQSNLLNVSNMFPKLKTISSPSILESITLPILKDFLNTSVLDKNLPTINVGEKSNLINSFQQNIIPFNTTSVLNFNSRFDDIVNFKINNILENDTNIPEIPELPYSDVLKLNSRFDDLIIKDINSVLKIYLSSNLPGSIPGVVNFFSDIYNTGFTINAQQGQTLFKLDTIPEHRNVLPTPEKSIADLKPIAITAEKTIANLKPIADTPKKNATDPIPLAPAPDKPISDINPSAVTPEKIIPNLIPIGETPEKNIANIHFPNEIPEKQPVQVFDGTNVPEKIGIDVTNGIVIPDKTLQAIEPTAVDFFPNDNQSGFIINQGSLITEFNYRNLPDLYEFNFNDNSYGGVLNQYAIYFSKYPPLSNVTYKTVIDWAYNRTIRVPNAQGLLDMGLNTPTVPVGNSELIVPPYQYANDRLPSWANTYLSTLEDVGSTLVSGFLSQKTIDLLNSFTNVDLTPMKQSSLAFQQLAGEIYWQYSELGTKVRNVRESAINFTSNLVGRQLAEIIIPKVESAIGGLTANLVNNTLNASILDSEKVLILYHILMGTKYTKSKAFFDRLTKTYSSKYQSIGDNAVNLFNDSSPYQKYLSGDSVNAIGLSVPYIQQSLAQTISNVTENIPGINVIGSSDEDNSISAIKSTLAKVVNDYSETMKIPIGNYEPGLINKYLRKVDSKTFGRQIEPEKYFSVNTPIERRTFTYDGPVLSGSIDKNHPTDEQKSKNPSLVPKTDLTALAVKNISDYNRVLSNNLFVANNNIAFNATKENSYLSLMKKRLADTGKLLDDKGFPSIKTQFSDGKNRLDLVKMPPSNTEEIGITKYEDDDLVDFFFEDLSSLSDSQESIVIPFRAIITSISDGISANWGTQDYMGRADKFYIYQGFERKVALSFDVAINSKDEFISSWNKINYLQGMCYPVAYPAEIALKAPIMSLTVGNLFDRIQVILNTFSISFDGSTLWEIEKGFQLPMYIKIQTDFTVIFADIPISSRKHYAQSQDWITPKVFDYNSDKNQSVENQNVITLDSKGSLSSIGAIEDINQLQNLQTLTLNT